MHRSSPHPSRLTLGLTILAAAAAAPPAALASDSPRRAPLLQRLGAVPAHAPSSPILPSAFPDFAPDSLGFPAQSPGLQPCFLHPPSAEEYAAWRTMMNPYGLRYWLAGGRWGPSTPNTPVTISWSFIPDGTIINGDPNVTTGPSMLFQAFDGQFGGAANRHLWVSHFEWAFRRWGELTGLSYVRVKHNGNDWDDGADFGAGGQLGEPGAPGLRGDVRIGGKQFVQGSPIAAGNAWPNLGGDMVFNFNVNFANDLTWFRNVCAHEHGHGIGLAHVCSSIPSLMGSAPGVDFSGVRGPQHDDIRAAMQNYGDAFEPNNSILNPSDLGNLPLHAVAAPSEETKPAIPFASRLSLVDGDEDYFRLAVPAASAVNISLAPVGTIYDANAFVDPAQNNGNPCNTGTTINSLALVPLRIQVLAANGTTVLSSATAAIAGASITLNNVAIPQGNFYLRIYESGTFPSPQLYDLTVTNGTPGPSNDNCARSTTIAGPGTIPGSTTNASPDGSSACPGNSTGDVWFDFTPTCSGTIALSTCGSSYDTVLSVHSACPHIGGTVLACNDDTGPGGACPVNTHSSLEFTAVAGDTYLIRLSGFNGATGNFNLQVAYAPPANDNCENAVAITTGSTFTGDTCLAGNDATGQCDAEIDLSRDVWFSYTPACNHQLRLNTEGSLFDTTLAVFTGSCAAGTGNLAEVACNDDFSGVTSQLWLNVSAGTTYLIRVAGYADYHVGHYALNVEDVTPPANDTCINATQVTSGLYLGTTCGAARETDDSCRPTSTSGDVWYRWAAPCSGNLVVSTCGSLYDTVVSIHQGACGLLTQIACNDDGGALVPCSPTQNTASYVTAPVTSGVIYFIRVSGYNGQSGGFLLNIDQQRNNDCDEAAPANLGNTPFSTVCATPSSGSPATCGSSNASPDVWFTHTATCTGPVWIDLCNANYDSVLSVRTASCNLGVELACNDDRTPLNPACASNLRSFLPFRAQAGNAYRIRISGFSGASGSGTMNIRCCPADFNLSGNVSVQDIYDFLSDWNSQIFSGPTIIASADFNTTGGISVQDIYDFLSAWNAGCN